MLLLITGHQRSGTTLLSQLCNMHPQMSMTNEFGNFLCLGQAYSIYIRRLLLRWGGISIRGWPLATSFAGRGPRQMVIRKNNLFVWQYLKRMSAKRGQVVTARVIEEVLREVLPPATVVGDKYPEYVYDLDALAADDNLSCLVIYRDCRDVTSSTLLKARNEWRRMPLFVRRLNTVEKIAHRWVRAIELMEKHRDRLFIVRYEDLVREVKQPVEELARWLDIDPKGFQVDRISDRSIGKHRRDLTAEELVTVTRIAGPTMSRLGYV